MEEYITSLPWTKIIIARYIQSNHALGNGIKYSEVPFLINSLNTRLKKYYLKDGKLDYSPESLDKISQLLFCYNKGLDDKNNIFNNEELVIQIIREIAAYIGEVFIKGYTKEGVWESGKKLLQTQFIYNKPGIAIKGNTRRKYKQRAIDIIELACEIIEEIKKGNKNVQIKPYYYLLKKREIKEKL
jgi:hypothetical protein